MYIFKVYFNIIKFTKKNLFRISMKESFKKKTSMKNLCLSLFLFFFSLLFLKLLCLLISFSVISFFFLLVLILSLSLKAFRYKYETRFQLTSNYFQNVSETKIESMRCFSYNKELFLFKNLFIIFF